MSTATLTERNTRREDNERRCRRIVATASPLAVDDLDWAAVGTVEVHADILDTLIYMRDVEGFTDRDLSGFAGHRTTIADPVIAPFLELWRSEEAVHAAVLDRYLRTYDAARAVGLPPRQLPPAGPAPILERVLAHVGGPLGRVVAAAHMAWGAANEQLTLHGYRLLAARTTDPVLSELLRRIAAQEARHFSFYFLQAQWRLASSRLARTVLRRILDGAWTPVGVGDGYKPAADFDAVLRYLAVGPDGARAIRRMDHRLGSLPGLAGVDIYQRLTNTTATTPRLA